MTTNKEHVILCLQLKRNGVYVVMTQTNENLKTIAEFNALFLTLNDKGQETALTVLQSLDFAQSVMCQRSNVLPCESKGDML